jgi:hypothetical protein
MAYSLITGTQATGVNRTTILRAKGLIGLLLGHFSGSRRAAPRCRIALRVFTPSGMPAVKIRCQIGPAGRQDRLDGRQVREQGSQVAS